MSQASHSHITSPAAHTNACESELTKAFNRWQTLNAEFEQALDGAARDLDREFAVGDQYAGPIEEAAKSMIDIPATTLQGIAQKIEVVLCSLKGGRSICGYEVRLLDSVIASIKTLA